MTPSNGEATYVKKTGSTMSGALSAPSFNTTSSRRYKQHIETLAPVQAIELLLGINLVSYTLKKDGTRQVGVIAEELADGPLDFVRLRQASDRTVTRKTPEVLDGDPR